MRTGFKDNTKPEQCSDLAELWKDMEPHQILASLRKDLGYTLGEISELSSYPQGTVETWSSGRYAPKKASLVRLIRIFSASDVAPSRKIRREMDAHHLSWDAGKGWRFRFTLMLNKKQVGKRIQLRLKTFDRVEAIQRRDVLCSCFRNLGLTVAGRKQVRKNARGDTRRDQAGLQE